jgi:hypothetical protein
MPPSLPALLASQLFLFCTLPTVSFLYMVFPSNGLVFLTLLGLGDQENEAVFPEPLPRRKGWEACLGCRVWTETHCGQWPGVTSCRVSRESIAVGGGGGLGF